MELWSKLKFAVSRQPLWLRASQSTAIRSKSNLFANHTEIMRQQRRGITSRSEESHMCDLLHSLSWHIYPIYIQVRGSPSPSDPLAAPSITIKVVNAPRTDSLPAQTMGGCFCTFEYFYSFYSAGSSTFFYFIYLFRLPVVHPLKHLKKNKIFILCSQYVVNLVAAADETKRN